MNFIRVFDSDYKTKLLSLGFKLLHENENEAVFIYEEGKFDFSKFDKAKVLLTNRLHF
jgi:hypothetical protein